MVDRSNKQWTFPGESSVFGPSIHPNNLPVWTFQTLSCFSTSPSYMCVFFIPLRGKTCHCHGIRIRISCFETVTTLSSYKEEMQFICSFPVSRTTVCSCNSQTKCEASKRRFEHAPKTNRDVPVTNDTVSIYLLTRNPKEGS